MFYSSLLLAWRSLDGCFDDRLFSLVFAPRDPHARRVVADLSSKIAYLFLLAENYAFLHCVEKFSSTLGALYWPSTQRQLHFANFNRSVLDFSWKVADGVVLTAQSLISFGLHVSQHCFCGPVFGLVRHLLFASPLAQSVLHRNIHDIRTRKIFQALEIRKHGNVMNGCIGRTLNLD